MRFIILSVLVFAAQSVAFAGSGFEGTYKVEQITENTHSWKNFWLRPNVEQLDEIIVEEIGSHLYIGLKDSQGLTWSTNYGVCTGRAGEYCNAYKSADGQTLELKFWGDWSWFVITLGQRQGKLTWTGDEASASLVFNHHKK
ncbi:hypothetical protein D3C87_1501350 [compost metagenome]